MRKPVGRIRPRSIRPTEEEPASLPHSSGPRGTAEGLRVLLVQENAVARSVIARALVRMGASVRAHDSFDQVKELADTDVVFCDLDAHGCVTAILELAPAASGVAMVGIAGRQDLGRLTMELAGMGHYRVLQATSGAGELVAAIMDAWRAARAD